MIKIKEHKLNELLASDNQEIYEQAVNLQCLGFPLDSIWKIQLKQVIK